MTERAKLSRRMKFSARGAAEHSKPYIRFLILIWGNRKPPIASHFHIKSFYFNSLLSFREKHCTQASSRALIPACKRIPMALFRDLRHKKTDAESHYSGTAQGPIKLQRS